MQKMTHNLVKKVISDKLSSYEFNFIWYLARRCDFKGECRGVYYDDVVNSTELNCSIANFYVIRDNLTKKGYIKWFKNHDTDMDITLLDNYFYVDFDGEPIYKNYINLNMAIFDDPEFYNLRVGAKKLALEIIRRFLVAKKQGNELKHNLNNHFKIYAKALNYTVRTVKSYFVDIKKWIHVELNTRTKKGKGIHSMKKPYHIVKVLESTCDELTYNHTKDSQYKENDLMYAEHLQYKHLVKTFCRHNKVYYSDLSLTDTADLIKQYRKQAKSLGMNIFNLLKKSISKTLLVNNELNSVHIHGIIRSLIETTYKREHGYPI